VTVILLRFIALLERIELYVSRFLPFEMFFRAKNELILSNNSSYSVQGMISAIIMSICSVQPEDIVEDYSLSANVYAEMNDHQAMVGALSQRSLDPKTFLGAPPEVMADTLISIEENYGSVEGYCDYIGFGPEKREKLRKALTE
jgi:hypothetical protein